MPTAVILGAGQMGQKLAALLNKNHLRLLAYGDNNPALHSGRAAVPVCSIADALALAPDLVFIGVASAGRSQALVQQARTLGYSGSIHTLAEAAALVDLRAAMLHTLAPRLACVDGALAELGVYQGDFAWQMNLVFPERPLHLFDTFSGFPAQDLAAEPFSHTQGKLDFSDTTAADVLARLPHPEQAIVHAGYFPDTADAALGPFALVSIDADLYAPTLAALDYFLPRMSPGGMLLLHDYANPRFAGVAVAVRDHEASHGPLALVPLPDLHGTAVILCGKSDRAQLSGKCGE